MVHAETHHASNLTIFDPIIKIFIPNSNKNFLFPLDLQNRKTARGASSKTQKRQNAQRTRVHHSAMIAVPQVDNPIRPVTVPSNRVDLPVAPGPEMRHRELQTRCDKIPQFYKKPFPIENHQSIRQRKTTSCPTDREPSPTSNFAAGNTCSSKTLNCYSTKNWTPSRGRHCEEVSLDQRHNLLVTCPFCPNDSAVPDPSILFYLDHQWSGLAVEGDY